MPEKENFPFKIHTNQNGTFGVFSDYPEADSLLHILEENEDNFLTNPLNPKRAVFKADFKINNQEFYIKGKDFNFIVGELGNYPHSLGDHEKENSMNFSALNELLINRKAQQRYQKRFGKNLLLEKPVGFFISTRDNDKGARWTVFEEIPNIIYEVPADKKEYLANKQIAYEKKFQKSLMKLTLVTGAGKLGMTCFP